MTKKRMTKRSRKLGIYCFIGFSLAFLLSLYWSLPSGYPFYWDSMNVSIEVQPNGDMLVTETQKYVFEKNFSDRRYRYLPLAENATVKDITVLENDRPVPISTGTEKGSLWIRWQHELTLPSTRTFVLKYRVSGGLYVGKVNTLVAWKAIFPDRPAPVRNARVQVRLPETLAGKITSFTSFGVPASARSIDSRTYEFIARQPLSPRESLEIQVIFPTGTLDLPDRPVIPLEKSPPIDVVRYFFAVLFLLLAPLAGLYGCFCFFGDSGGGGSCRRRGGGSGGDGGGFGGGGCGGSGGGGFDGGGGGG